MNSIPVALSLTIHFLERAVFPQAVDQLIKFMLEFIIVERIVATGMPSAPKLFSSVSKVDPQMTEDSLFKIILRCESIEKPCLVRRGRAEVVLWGVFGERKAVCFAELRNGKSFTKKIVFSSNAAVVLAP